MRRGKTYTRELAGFLRDLVCDVLPEATRTKVSQCMLDWLGAAWNGSNHELGQRYTAVALALGGAEATKGACPIVGAHPRTAMPWAVFANAALGHIAEVDDGHRTSIMHVGTVVIPVVLALAERRRLGGRAITESIVCGYEAAIRAGECLGREHYTTFHTTATAGVFGAAAAASKALGLSHDATIWALGHAGTQAAGLWQFLEDNALGAKPFHPAKAAQNGVVAANLAAMGIEGAERIFEGDRGFCRSASPSPDYDRLVDGLGTRFKIDEINFKAYPSCGQTHSMLDALRSIIERHGVFARDVESIEVRAYRRAIDIAGKAEPTTLQQARFSIAFCLAFLLSRGELTFENLTQEAVHDPKVRELMRRVELISDPDMDAGFPASRPCRITLRLRNGKKVSAEKRFRRGDPEDPMDTPALRAKFNQLTRTVLSAEQQHQIIDWCAGLEHAHRVEAFLFENRAG